MDKLYFIIAHHSTCKKDTELLINNIKSIRYFYPSNKIIIIKTSISNIPQYILDENIYVYNKSNDNTFIMGIIPLLCNILEDNDKYILMHDSMYLINVLSDDILLNDIYTLWDFNKYLDVSSYQINELISIIDIKYPELLIELHKDKSSKKWNGCFGPAFGGNIKFLKKINNILNIEKNMKYFEGRAKLELSERIISIIIAYIKITDNLEIDCKPLSSLNGSIFNQPNAFGKEYDISLEYIKNKAITYNYNKYFYKLWFLRN